MAEDSSTVRFSNRANTYVRARPSYPREIVAWLLDGFADRFSLTAADIGAGTGISSRLLADFVGEVLAVEPNAEMAAAAEAHPRVTYVNARAESSGLGSASVDLVTYFQSLHWCEPAAAFYEAARILRPGGRFGAIWNERDERDAFTAGYGAAIKEAAGEEACRILERRAWRPDYAGELKRHRFERIEHAVFRNSQRLTRDMLLDRARSASYIPLDGEVWSELEKRLLALFTTFSDSRGEVTLRYRTSVHRASYLQPDQMRRRSSDLE